MSRVEYWAKKIRAKTQPEAAKVVLIGTHLDEFNKCNQEMQGRIHLIEYIYKSFWSLS